MQEKSVFERFVVIEVVDTLRVERACAADYAVNRVALL